jgi:hypothetical protein
MNKLTFGFITGCLAIAGLALVSLQLEAFAPDEDPPERALVATAHSSFQLPICTSQFRDARISCVSAGR